MKSARWAAWLLSFALLCPTLLTACSGETDLLNALQTVATTAVTTTGSATVQTAPSPPPTAASITTTAKVPETADEPQTSTGDLPDLSDSNDSNGGTSPVTKPAGTTTDKPMTTMPPTSTTTVPTTANPTTTAPIVTTTAKPVTTTAVTTTAKPTTTTAVTTTAPTTTTAKPATTTVPVTGMPETSAPPEADCDRTVLLYEDFKAMWISQYDMNPIYTQDGKQRDQASYTALVQTVLDNVRSLGFNTVFLQVRPNADSMYPSEFYPMSKYVVGSYGREASYDPVAIFIEEAHARGLSVHAWINPLRCMKAAEITAVDSRYLIRQWYDDENLNGKYIVLYNGTYYLNPAYEEVRRLIVDGAAELLDRYAFDGLHMDDYFYPTTNTSFDLVAYTEYTNAGGTLEIYAFRRAQIDLLVSALYCTTKAECEQLVYGISPEADLQSVYNTQFADVYNWCASEGYIDYICPQVYFGFEHATMDFASVCDSYRDLIKTDSVKLLIGMTLGKAFDGYDKWAGSGKNEWSEHKDILKRSLEYTATLENCAGVSIFCYQFFYGPTSGIAVSETAEEVANFTPVLKEISWKQENEITE